MDKWAPTGKIEKFLSNLRPNSKFTIKITPENKFSCVYAEFEILAIFKILKISDDHFGQMTKIIGNFFFVIFFEDDII